MNKASLLIAMILFATQPSVSGSLRSRVAVLVPPAYPPLAKAAGIQGTIRVSIVIEKNGIVSHAEAIPWKQGAEPDASERVLRREALENARQWRFEPLADGIKRERLTIEYVFRMEGKPTYYQSTRICLQLPTRVEVITQPPSAER